MKPLVAFIMNPKILVLDEPTEGIQPNIVHDIGLTIRKLVEDLSMSVILVEQKLSFVRRFADTFYIMDRGRIVANGQVADLSDQLVDRHLTV